MSTGVSAQIKGFIAHWFTHSEYFGPMYLYGIGNCALYKMQQFIFILLILKIHVQLIRKNTPPKGFLQGETNLFVHLQ